MIVLQRLQVQALKQLRDIDLCFPQQGSVLIEGQNEAGKSTLFEAIYFALYGAPLVGEETRATLEDLLPHDKRPVQVTLTVTTAEATLEIQRRLAPATTPKRLAQEASVVVRRAGGAREEVHGASAVNARILQELHGLDGDALRNSCFMEQKALDRVERLSRDQRTTAVARLVGIERLRQIEKELRATGEEQQRLLAQATAVYEVAVAQQAASEAEQKAVETAEQAQAARVALLLEERQGRSMSGTLQRQQQTDLETQRAKLVAQIEATTQIQALQAALADVGRLLVEAEEAAEDYGETAQVVNELAQIERERLPALTARVMALQTLEEQIGAAEALRGEVASAENAVVAAASIVQMQAGLRAAEQDYKQASAAVARATQQRTLTRWLHMKELVELSQGEGKESAALATEIAALNVQMTRRRAAARRSDWIARSAAILAILALLLGLRDFRMWTIAVLFALVALLAQRHTVRQRRRLQQGQQEQVNLVMQQTRLDTKAETARQMAGTTEELARLEAWLHRAGLDVTDAESGRAALTRLDVDAGEAEQSSESQALQQQEVAHQAVAELQARLRAAQYQFSQTHQLTDAAENSADKNSITGEAFVEQAQQRLALRQDELRQHEGAIARQSAACGVTPELRAAVAANSVTVAERDHLAFRVQELPALTQRLHSYEEAARNTTLAAQNALNQFGQQWQAAELPELQQAPGTPANLHDMRAIYQWHEQTLAEQLAAQSNPADAANLAIVNERLQLLGRDMSGSSVTISLDGQIAELLAVYGIGYSEEDTYETLAERWRALAYASGAQLDAYEQTFLIASQQAHHLRQSATERATALQLTDTELDIEVCSAQVAACEQSCRRYALAVEMAQQVRARILRRILPETEAHMRALLPELTANRYRDVQLLAEDANNLNADLSIRLWDETAGRYVAKNLFSGGTRDQCSLALRLAFALATLPKDAGVMPGFIFLDEPLSSFDAERTQALVHILTEGVIAQQFDQVVLISHSQSFDASSFRYHLRLEHGRIVESNLPQPTNAAADASVAPPKTTALARQKR